MKLNFLKKIEKVDFLWRRKNLGSLLFIFFVIAISFWGGREYEKNEIYLENILNREPMEELEKVDFSLFWESWKILDEKFVVDENSEKITDQEKIWGAVKGLASSFKDPYTVFMPPSDSEIFESDIKGNFEGVGMEIGIRNDNLVVVAPLKNTPAEKAGIMPKDVILEIDGKPTKNMGTEEAVKIIRGEKGTEVKLLVVREGEMEPLEISIIRDVINIPVIETKIKDDVFIISLYSFTATSPELFREALQKFLESFKDKLIIDLRGNPGGYLEAANDIASWFLPTGELVVTENYGKSLPDKVHTSRGYNIFNDNLKLVILINGGSASASEILAGALREHEKATLIGTKSFGKGSVQELVKVTPDTSLKITVARWLTPEGNSISDNGLEPDIEVEMTLDDLKEGKDPQLEKAIEYLKNLN